MSTPYVPNRPELLANTHPQSSRSEDVLSNALGCSNDMRSEMGVVYFEHISFNKIYSGTHWAVRAKWKENIHRAVCDCSLLHVQPFNNPVVFVITPLVRKGRKLFDCSNYTLMWKMVEDALVSEGLLVDDSPAYVYGFAVKRPVRSEVGDGFNIEVKEVLAD